MKRPFRPRHTPMQRVARVMFPLIVAITTVQPLAYAAPSPTLLSQAPMFIDVTVPANVAFILDDSQSMASGRLPLPAGVTAPTASSASWSTPVPGSTCSGAFARVMTEPVTGGQIGFRTSEPERCVAMNDLLYRAPSLNPQYYNPAITYRPWNNNGVRMPNASFAVTARSDGFRPGQTRHDMRFVGPNYTTSTNLGPLRPDVQVGGTRAWVGANAETFDTAGGVETPAFTGCFSVVGSGSCTAGGGTAQNVDLFTKPMVRTGSSTACSALNTSTMRNFTTPAACSAATCSGTRVARIANPSAQWRREAGCTETWGAWGPAGGAEPATPAGECPMFGGGTRPAWKESSPAFFAPDTAPLTCPSGTTDMGRGFAEPRCCPTASFSSGQVNRNPGSSRTRWRQETSACTRVDANGLGFTGGFPTGGAWTNWSNDPIPGVAPTNFDCPNEVGEGTRLALVQAQTESTGAACPALHTDMGGGEPRCCPNTNFLAAFNTPGLCEGGPGGGTTCPCGTGGATTVTGCPAGQTCPLADTWYTAPRELALARYYRYEFIHNPTPADEVNRQPQKSQTSRYRLVELDRDSPDKLYPVVDADGRPAKRLDCQSTPPFDGSICSWGQEAQNFANWYTYHRMRLFSAIGVVAEALSELTAANFGRDRFRLAYGSLNYFPTGPDPYAANPATTRLASTLTVDPTAGAVDNSGILVRGVRPFLQGSTDRQQVFNWLFSLRHIGSTPNREVLDSVGRYFTRTDQLGPWADNPGVGGGRPQLEHIPCRRNFALVMTDGEWTNRTNATLTSQAQPRLEDMPNASRANPPLASQSAATIFNARSQPGPVHTGGGTQTGNTYQYLPANEPQWTVSGDPTGTLTDAALYYWSRDLRTDLLNNIPPLSTNEAFWQNMTTHIIGFGVSASRDNAATRAAVTAKVAPSPVWPAVNTNSGVIGDRDITPVNCGYNAATNPSGCGRVDDTMRAALAGRGDFLAANNVVELAQKVTDVLEQLDTFKASGTAPAATRSRVASGDRVFVASFQTSDWFGELVSYDALTYVNDLSSGGPLTATPQWSASFPAWGSRKMFTSTGASAAGVAFSYANLTAAQQTAVGSADIVDYIRGNPALETSGAFRKRGGRLLGSIVNSDPIYSKASDFGYNGSRSPAAAAGNGASYPAFVTGNSASRRGAVYVGANAGALHAFDATSGEELFAYVPRAVMGQLPELTWLNYGHKFFVDGPVVQGDAYWGSAWRSVIVGTSGNGPKSIFALDVTNPAPAAENGRPAFGTANVLWDLTGADHADLGNITEPGFVAAAMDGNWYYFVGNGWESQNDKATLLAINLKDGTVRSIPTDSVGGTNSTWPTQTSYTDRTNGLGGVTPVFDAQRNVVAVYGGDRLGRLWKFDLSSASPTSWKVATDLGKPLFEAIDGTTDKYRQPITAAPRITQHPAGGNLIVFGTGKMYDVLDKTNVNVQSVYALWEKPGSNAQIATSRSDTSILQLTLRDVAPPTGSPPGTRDDRAIDGEENIDWTVHNGWFFDLKTTAGAPGERVLSSPSAVGGFVQFSTFSPAATANGDPCVGTGTSYFYRLAVANNLSDTTPAFTTPRAAEVIGVAILPTLETRAIAKAPTATVTPSKTLSAAELKAALDAPPGTGAGQCPPGTFSSIAGVSGMTPVGVNCLAPPLRQWRELPRGPR